MKLDDLKLQIVNNKNLCDLKLCLLVFIISKKSPQWICVNNIRIKTIAKWSLNICIYNAKLQQFQICF